MVETVVFLGIFLGVMVGVGYLAPDSRPRRDEDVIPWEYRHIKVGDDDQLYYSPLNRW